MHGRKGLSQAVAAGTLGTVPTAGTGPGASRTASPADADGKSPGKLRLPRPLLSLHLPFQPVMDSSSSAWQAPPFP